MSSRLGRVGGQFRPCLDSVFSSGLGGLALPRVGESLSWDLAYAGAMGLSDRVVSAKTMICSSIANNENRTRAQTTDGMRNNLRKRYDEHFAEIRRLVPKEQLLEFKLGDGWGPLCEFLNCPIPDVPYPHMNSSKDIDKARNGFYVFCLLKASWNLAKWPMAIGVGCLAVKMAGVDVGSVFSEWW